jgi:signal transduction histidine kinase
VNLSALRFTRRILSRQTTVGIGSSLAIAGFAPRLLGLEDGVASSVLTAGAGLALIAFTLMMVSSIVTLRRHRGAIAAIARGEATISPHELGHLAGIPGQLSTRSFLAAALTSALVLVPGVRPDGLDDGRAVSLLILTITFLGASTIPLYVLVRRATLDLFEIAPPEPLTALLETLEYQSKPAQRIHYRLLLAVMAPVALVGVGAVLIAHAQLRTFTEQNSRNTAILLARATLDRGPGGARGEAARADAIAAAAELGYLAVIDKAKVAPPPKAPSAAPDAPPGPTPDPTLEPTWSRESDGQIAVIVPLDVGHATVRFSADLSARHISGGAAIGLLGLVLAAIFGRLFGRALADDLVAATKSVRLLGTESVLRGTTRMARPARFAVVESLARAIEALTQRFQVFAAAQERALAARAAAQHMRGLLFASVSHDLKSPLNAILGFAELVGQEQLTSAQHESLSLISKRGRELLGLIETILDAARVEAEQLDLFPRPSSVERLVTEGIRKARELSGEVDLPITVEITEGLPLVPLDPSYGLRALAVIVAHAIRSGTSQPGARAVRLRALLPTPPFGKVCIEVEYGSRDVTREELVKLFARQATGRGEGLTLGLSLARSVIELHGGAVDVSGEQDGVPVCRIYLPTRSPSLRPKLSSFPALG